MIEIPALPGFVPAIVSSSRGKFVVSKKLTRDNRIRVGIFNYDSDRLDEVITDLFNSAFMLSQSENWGNIFLGPNSAKLAREYIREQSGMRETQPHICLIPDSWDSIQVKKFFKSKLDGDKYDKHCSVISTKVAFPVFCSRPDMVGMHTQFLGGGSGIILHNVKFGLAFCIDSIPDVVC